MNHLGNANKMVSDTPRTDAHTWHDGDYDDPFHAFYDFARTLERELNAANDRIKRLEEAGNEIVDYNIGCGCGHDGPCRACRMACEAWEAAKEAKP